MARQGFEKFREKALEQSGVAEEYSRLAPAYDLRRKLVALRQSAGLTQEEVAVRLNTQKSNVSRLESVHSDISPNLSTIVDYAGVLGFCVQIDFVPRESQGDHNGLPHTLSKSLPANRPRTSARRRRKNQARDTAKPR